MVQFDNEARQIKIKIVYYGPAVGGKTTSLRHIHRIIDPERRTKLYSLNTADDRTLFFDLLSLNLGRIRGYQLTLQLYTVPGQVQYDATRRTVLAGADGIVFVADSQIDQRQPNLDSLANLHENMAANGLDTGKTPLVFQFNKRDLSPIQTLEEMEEALNSERRPSFPAVATSGDGVLDVFTKIGEETLVAVADKLGIGTNPEAIDRLQKQMHRAMQPFLGGDASPEQPSDVEVTLPEHEGDASEPLSNEVLVAEAVRANLAMADVNVRLDSVRRQLEQKVRVMDSISAYGRAVSNERDPATVLRLLITNAIRLLQVQGASVLIVQSAGKLRDAVVHGFKQDPFAAAFAAGESAAADLLEVQSPRIVSLHNDEGMGSGLHEALRGSGFVSAVVVPLLTQDRPVGLLTAYGDEERAELDENDLQVATVLASTAAMGYSNAIAWRQMQDFNRGLETQVTERTSELQNAYRELAALDEMKNEFVNRLSLEFRTPVTSLFTAAKIFKREEHIPPEKSQRLTTVIYDEAEKLLEMITSIFQASVLMAGVRKLEKSPVPAQELIREAIAPLRDLANDRKVSLQVLIPSGLKTISCDPESTCAALRAIVRNAIEFSSNGSEVKLEVRRVVRGSDPWLQLRVSDTGVGIPKADLPHVSEAFWQGDDSSAGKRYGIGLGLAIAKRAIENNGGALSIRSVVEEGTEAVLSLPQ